MVAGDTTWNVLVLVGIGARCRGMGDNIMGTVAYGWLVDLLRVFYKNMYASHR